MGRVKVSLRGGIFVEAGATTYVLDPKGPVRADYAFVSHAHLDHVHGMSDSRAKVLSSNETRMLASARGLDIGGRDEDARADGVTLLDSGHILGARAICIADELLYTGDAAGRRRAFMDKCRTRRAKVLVTECTFGQKDYVFPPTSQIVKEVNQTIGTLFDRGKPVVLMGYALGKSQVLSHLFSCWSPLYIHDDVRKMSEVYRECGVQLDEGRAVSKDMENLPQGPWVMITPFLSSRSPFFRRLKKEFGAAVIAFSGWAASGPGYKYSVGADYAFPLSDHCDFQELLALVRDVSPELVYTTHGFTEEFAAVLRKEGFDARPLNGYQSVLTES